MHLDEWPLPYVRLICQQCGREGKVATERLQDRFGDEADMSMILEPMVGDCHRPNKAEPCIAKFADALLVDAILDPENALEPALVPQAQALRQELGL